MDFATLLQQLDASYKLLAGKRGDDDADWAALVATEKLLLEGMQGVPSRVIDGFALTLIESYVRIKEHLKKVSADQVDWANRIRQVDYGQHLLHLFLA